LGDAGVTAEQQVREAIVTAAASKLTYVGGWGGAAAAWAASVDWLAAAGVLIGISGLLVNIFFKARRDARESRIALLEADLLLSNGAHFHVREGDRGVSQTHDIPHEEIKK
jgi:hypothetical protein